MLVITNQALRDQIVAFSATDIAAIRNGYASEGVHEAREVIEQLMAGPANSRLLSAATGWQGGGRQSAGDGRRTGTVEFAFSSRGQSGKYWASATFLAPGLYVFSGSDMARLRAVQAHILNVMLDLFAASMLIAIAGGALVSRSFLRRTDAMARACRDIMHGDLKLRIPVRGTQDELDRLAEAINEMLSRISALDGKSVPGQQ